MKLLKERLASQETDTKLASGKCLTAKADLGSDYSGHTYIIDSMTDCVILGSTCNSSVSCMEATTMVSEIVVDLPLLELDNVSNCY